MQSACAALYLVAAHADACNPGTALLHLLGGLRRVACAVSAAKSMRGDMTRTHASRR